MQICTMQYIEFAFHIYILLQGKYLNGYGWIEKA